ncbi:MAG: hypothetical protein MUC65_02370 [Pontiellaceae bacterium]|nr:hypothetical protein [Pontiellaceae bacterium]
MKTRLQLTPELAVASVCAAGWFSLWLFAFRPAPHQPPAESSYPEVIRLVTDNETLRKLSTPTLFALPSDEGFSGRFVEDKITEEQMPKKPNSPARYLSREIPETPNVDQVLLTCETRLPQSELPIPGTAISRPAIPPVPEIQLFLSPELKSRAGEFPPLKIASTDLPETLRVNLSVNPNGIIKHAFFETPVTNAALLTAIRNLSFKPAEKQTDGWIEIRFAPKEKN